ncbi:MAG: lipopolysaccharide transport periplasmic protein LptA [Desulfuromonas thiophila]|nr:lipopolysaccharide transport periplasmic protein LptA [Desulfuromonas thiophila]MDY0398536.1 lipopolysaccharide transport periplasmic protein LptA [Desulfuromonas thiophila]
MGSKKSERRRFWLVAVVLLGLLAGSGWAAQEGQIQHDSGLPVQVVANQLQVDDVRGLFVFSGQVQARQDQATIYADKLTVFYQQQGSKRQIERVLAEGAVRIVQLDRVAYGERAEFFVAEARIELGGTPRVVQGENEVAGETIRLYLNERRSQVEGGSQQRVRAIFVPEHGDAS